jgi:hypothetical protein
MVVGVCFVLVFLVGYGTGSYVRVSAPKTFKQSNYTTNTNNKPVVFGADAAAPQGTKTSSSTPTNCIVKGNISSTGKKIYHVVGGAFYAKVHPEQCFNTEAEAVVAGFVKSSR